MLLASTKIWGRLLLIDSNSHTKQPTSSWILEVLKRSGSSPLSMEASSWIRSKERQDQLSSIMKIEWHRMQRITIRVFQVPFDTFYLPILSRPAPLLVELRQIDHYAMRVRRNSEYPPLFSNAAPRLLHLAGECIPVSLQSSWLSTLTELNMGELCTFTNTAQETLEALRGMPRLQSLTLSHQLQDTITSIETVSDYDVVQLNCLTYMAIRASAINCFALVDRIKCSPSGCLINFKVNFGSSTPSPEIIMPSLFDRVFSQNVRFLHGIDSLDWMCIRLDLLTVLIADYGCGQYSLVNGGSRNYYPGMSPSGTCTEFILYTMRDKAFVLPFLSGVSTSPAVRKLTTLRLIFNYQHEIRAFLPFLLDFTSVTTLEAPVETLAYLERVSSTREHIWPRDSNGLPIIPFPNLTKLLFESQDDAYQHSQVLCDFLRNRSHIETKIMTVEFMHTTNIRQFARDLEGTPGLVELIGGDEYAVKVSHFFDGVQGASLTSTLRA